jgi:hypothetical protein
MPIRHLHAFFYVIDTLVATKYLVDLIIRREPITKMGRDNYSLTNPSRQTNILDSQIEVS